MTTDNGRAWDIRIRLQHQVPRHPQYRRDLATGLPLITAKDAKTHAALVIVRDVGMVDLGLEREGRGLERVVLGKREEELEGSALYRY